MNDYNFGNFVCFLREKKGLTQRELAQILDITPAAVSKWENGASKPRLDMLFRLAEILEVTPEELMAGCYLPNETTNDEITNDEAADTEGVETEDADFVNEKYNYLPKIKFFATTDVKIKRVFAFLIDWLIAGGFSLLSCTLLIREETQILLAFLCIISFPVLVVLRDALWRGRSIGKRIFGLTVLDKQTAKAPTFKQAAIRDVFFFLMYIDFFVLVLRGQSIGDLVANTVVLPKKYFDSLQTEESFSEPNTGSISASLLKSNPKESRRKYAMLLGGLAVIAITVVIVFLNLGNSMEEIKSTEEYRVAYEYLVNSDTVSDMGVGAEEINCSGYSRFTAQGNSDSHDSFVKFVFKINRKSLEVVCHQIGEEWYVCEECTKFQ